MPPRSRQSWPLGTRLTPSDLQAERPSAVCREDALERRELQESVSGGFTWAIDNFSKCRAEVLRSAPGYLVVVPKFTFTTSFSPANPPVVYMSVYLGLHGAAELPHGWSFAVDYEITLLSHHDERLNHKYSAWCLKALRAAPHVFRALFAYGVVLSSDALCFIRLSDLNDPRKGFLKNDTLRIQTAVTLYFPLKRALHQDCRTDQLKRYVESLHGDEATSDVEVRVGASSSSSRSCTFLGHKTILAQAPFFRTKFASAVGEDSGSHHASLSKKQSRAAAAGAASSSRSTRAVVELPQEEVTPDAFGMVMEFLYKVGTTPTFPRGLKLLEVHSAAHFLLLTGLEEMCMEACGEQLSVEVLVPFLRYANLHNLTSLKDACFNFATESGAQLGDFMATEGFTQLVTEDRELYLEFVEHLRTICPTKKRRL